MFRRESSLCLLCLSGGFCRLKTAVSIRVSGLASESRASLVCNQGLGFLCRVREDEKVQSTGV